MSILNAVTSGVQQTGQRIVIAGVEKVGKTTLACSAAGALLVPLETGYAAMSCPRTPKLETWGQVDQLLEELKAGCKAGRVRRGSSIVWDSASALERLIHEAVIMSDPGYANAYDQKTGALKKNAKAITMETAHGGYGKAYIRATDLFKEFLDECDQLAIYGGVNIILTCHTFAARVVDPAHGEFDTWDLLLHSPKNQRNYGKRELLTQWADLVGFLHEPMFIQKAAENGNLVRGISANQGRVLAVDRTPQWVAGNRYGIAGVVPIPPGGGWNNLAQAIHASCGVDVFNRG